MNALSVFCVLDRAKATVELSDPRLAEDLEVIARRFVALTVSIQALADLHPGEGPAEETIAIRVTRSDIWKAKRALYGAPEHEPH